MFLRTADAISFSPDLVQDENGVWRMDYADMDRKLKEHKHSFRDFLALPHNPTGRVWEREEIERRWKFTKQMNALSSPMRSGLT